MAVAVGGALVADYGEFIAGYAQAGFASGAEGVEVVVALRVVGEGDALRHRDMHHLEVDTCGCCCFALLSDVIEIFGIDLRVHASDVVPREEVQLVTGSTNALNAYVHSPILF